MNHEAGQPERSGRRDRRADRSGRAPRRRRVLLPREYQLGGSRAIGFDRSRERLGQRGAHVRNGGRVTARTHEPPGGYDEIPAPNRRRISVPNRIQRVLRRFGTSRIGRQCQQPDQRRQRERRYQTERTKQLDLAPCQRCRDVPGKPQRVEDCGHRGALMIGSADMDALVDSIATHVLPVLATWETVDSVVVLPEGADRYDPGFRMTFDVYHHGRAPEPAERERAFLGQALTQFESSEDGTVDRVHNDDVPIRIQYVSIQAFDDYLQHALEPWRGFLTGGAYQLYRLLHGKVLLNRGTWLDTARGRVRALPKEFFAARSRRLVARAQHSYEDFAGAVWSGDAMWYQLCLGTLLAEIAGTLFALNERLPPARRAAFRTLRELERLPNQFETRIQYVLGVPEDLGPKRRLEIAGLILRDLRSMVLSG